MDYAEPVTLRRYIPVYIKDASSVGVTGLTPVGSANLQVSLSGAAFVNGAGTWIEIGAGAYWYVATVAECTTASFLTLKVLGGDKPFVITVSIGGWITSGETDAAYLRVPIYLVDASGSPVSGRNLTGEITVAIGSLTAWTAATGSWAETGSGCYYYVAPATDVAGNPGQIAIKVVDSAALPFVMVIDVADAAVTIATSCGSYVGDYLGGCDVVTTVPATTVPLVAVVSAIDPAARDVAAEALSRLIWQFKSA